ncbi:hypothetical protein, conserved [Babesia bigemina]|uniref:Uncharacterized protein n=1 Tax=Babesia bigemina TaxID=5866 RepID=A0A061DDA6_BABBI|nr:hypothetical protein, conserved [Babesia bigemina]CDR96105.1 hypothetical protein, conserved [Babesia bigemina]|eukprot:XP_012768291.1 hypothetical protein, conserved [Babesia bigemina]
MRPVVSAVLCTLWLYQLSPICEALPGNNIRDTVDAPDNTRDTVAVSSDSIRDTVDVLDDNTRDTVSVPGGSNNTVKNKREKEIGEGEYCPIPRLESINPVWDPEEIYAKHEGKLSDFDRNFYKFWKGAFATGRFGGMKLWKVVAAMGDAFLSAMDKLGILKQMEKAERENYYLFNDYEEEFDAYLDEEANAYLEKKLAEPVPVEKN